MKKILLIDVDGTLVQYDNTLPESAKKAVQLARENGHLVYLCTGRSEAEIQQEIRDMGYDGLLGGNGSYIKDHDQVVMHQHLSYQDCETIVEWFRENDIEFFLECNSGLYASEHFEDKALDGIKIYLGLDEETSKGVTVRSVFTDMTFGYSGDQLIRDDVNKISFLLNKGEDLENAKKELPQFHIGSWGGATDVVLFGDVSPEGITKQHAVEVLLNHLQRSKEDAIAFGDATVDIPMFESCGYAVAMGSAGKECKEKADYITDDVDKDGLYKAFIKLGLIQE